MYRRAQFKVLATTESWHSWSFFANVQESFFGCNLTIAGSSNISKIIVPRRGKRADL
jgi:hypothetical protein